MTDDIVTRLREQADSGYIDEHDVMLRIAADEIEDYRADLKRHFDMITKQREEIERLQKACDYYHKMCSMIADKNFTANEEIHRLKLILTHICDVWGSDLYSITNEMKEIQKGLCRD